MLVQKSPKGFFLLEVPMTVVRGLREGDGHRSGGHRQIVGETRRIAWPLTSGQVVPASLPIFVRPRPGCATQNNGHSESEEDSRLLF